MLHINKLYGSTKLYITLLLNYIGVGRIVRKFLPIFFNEFRYNSVNDKIGNCNHPHFLTSTLI